MKKGPKLTFTLKENGVYLQKKAVLFGELYFYSFNSHGTLPKSHYIGSLGGTIVCVGGVLYILSPSAAAICLVVEMAGITLT